MLHLVTDRRRLCGDAPFSTVRDCLLRQARYAVEAGIDFFQVRERDLEAADLAALVSVVVAMARGTRTRVLVNDRVDVALACGAAGVHLKADSIPASAVRSITPPEFVVGRSVHGALEAQAAGNAVDYLIAGTVWATPSKPDGHPVVGERGLSDIVRASRVPVIAIGGVTLDRLGLVAASGAAGAAGIGLFMASEASVPPLACRAISLRDLTDAARARFDTSTPAP
jgi:thiamine-phosphate pyrophosphorylase